ncbi:tetratricopeptide repeat protein [bacterium]
MKKILLIIFLFYFSANVYAVNGDEQELYNTYIKAFLYDFSGDYKQALDEYLKTIKYVSENIERDKDIIITLWRNTNIDEAKEKAEAFLKEYPDDYDILIVLSYIYGIAEELDEAISYAEKAYESNAENPEVFYYLGLLWERKGDNEKALKYFLSYSKLEPNVIEMKKIIANIYQRLDNKKEAVKYYEEIVEKEPNNSRVLWNLAILYEHEDLLKAEEYYSKALHAENILLNKMIIINKIGTLDWQMNNNQKARHFFEHCVRLGEKNIKDKSIELQVAYAYTMLISIAQKENNWKEAVKYQKKILKRDADDIYQYIRLAYFYDELKNKKQSIKVLKKALRVFPKSSELRFYIGLGYKDLNKFNKALKYFKKIIEYNPEYVKAYYNLGVIYEQTGKKQKAFEIFEKLLSIDNKDAAASNYVGYMLAEEGRDIDRALELINTALESEPDNYAYIDSLGWVYYKNGELSKALKELKKASKMSYDPIIHRHLAEVLYELSRKEEAFLAYDTALWFDAEISNKYITRFNRLFPSPDKGLIQRRVKQRIEYFFREIRKSIITGKVKISIILDNKMRKIKGRFYYDFPDKLSINILHGHALLPSNIIIKNSKVYLTSLFESKKYIFKDDLIEYFVNKGLFMFPDIKLKLLKLEKQENSFYYFSYKNYIIKAAEDGFIVSISILTDSKEKEAELFISKWDKRNIKSIINWPKYMMLISYIHNTEIKLDFSNITLLNRKSLNKNIFKIR